MKWVARQINESELGVFLLESFTKRGQTVCYGVASGPYAKVNAETSAKRYNESHLLDLEIESKEREVAE